MWIFPKKPEKLNEKNTNYYHLLDSKKEYSLWPQTDTAISTMQLFFSGFGENTIKRNPHIDNMACVEVTEMHSRGCRGPTLILPEINYSEENSDRWEIEMGEELTDGK